MEKIKIQDDSGDKKYFTIIPNYILNHSTIWDREVYIQMKRITGEDGTCWTSRKTLSKQCGMSERRLDKSLSYLIDHKWIKKVGVKKVLTQGGVQEVNEYRLSDLWKMNVEYYESKGIAPETPPSSKGVAQNNKRGSTDESKGIAPCADKEEPYTKKNHLAKQVLPSKEINELLDLFKEVNPLWEDLFKNKTERGAIEALISRFGVEKVHSMIVALPGVINRPYAPKITKPTELRRDLGKLIAFYNQSKLQTKGKKIIGL